MKEASAIEIIKSIILYSACSSSLLLVNKLVIALIPLHSYISCAQFAFASIAVIIFNEAGLIERIDYLDYEKGKAYMLYVLTFIFGLYSNFRALEASNIETVIVFRACTPLAVSVLDFFFLGRELPSPRSLAALCAIALGAYFYVNEDEEFISNGLSAYTWVTLWFVSLCFNMTYGKMILKKVKSSNTWDSVYYVNALSFLPMFIFGTVMADEWTKYRSLDLEEDLFKALMLLLISCIAGLGIGYSGWKCRSLVSPTSYTLVGVINKLFTIAMSLALTDDTSTTKQIFWLVFAISGSAFYRQAPFRDEQKKNPATPNLTSTSVNADGDEEENIHTLQRDETADKLELLSLNSLQKQHSLG